MVMVIKQWEYMGIQPFELFKYDMLAGWWFRTFVIFHFIYGMSSFPLTNFILQDGYCTTNQIYYSLDQVLITNLY